MPEIGDIRATFIPPYTTSEEVADKIPPYRSLFLVTDLLQLRVSDGETPGGVIVTGGSGGGGGGGNSFANVGVTGQDVSLWLHADDADDLLTITPLRGLVVVPVPSSDTLQIGFPDGGAYGNVWTALGATWGPAPPAQATYVPQEGDISTDILIEGNHRKLWDGWAPLSVYLPDTNPASVMLINGVPKPLMLTGATGLLRAEHRIGDCGYTAASLVLKCNTAATSGTAQFVARVDKPASATASVTFDTDNTANLVPPGGDFTVTIPLTHVDGAVAGDSILVEFGRISAGDTVSADISVVDAWFVVA